ncbi:hypothetical protein LJ739_10930 [Aestuariibacter halophilus]|uniref:FlgO domain-containing protein n=1 Tax=Fluctibacter halophilus TaxID=226011 RepID=A0ABS8GC21_9ALTE|nr:FlgO family outer membrane protein [Aestuariibacter halophilus]MCC2616756.1 hypothetical protein [Aestuariibacter halophilus]
MKQALILVGLGVLLSGCSSTASFTNWFESEETQMEATTDAPQQDMQVVNVTSPKQPHQGDAMSTMESYYKPGADNRHFGALDSQPEFSNGQGVYNGRLLTKHVGDYVQSMTQDLVANMEHVTDKTAVGVTHFALLDSDLGQTNLLGYQLAESFMHELHKFRIPVIDYKATEYIRVTDAGDFFLTRDFLELSNTAPIDYILTGTLTRHQGGYLVNARILGLKTKAVVATAQSMLPFFVVDALLPSQDSSQDGVRVIEGD